MHQHPRGNAGAHNKLACGAEIVRRTVSAHQAGIRASRRLKDLACAGHKDCSIKVWHMESGRQVASWAGGHPNPPQCLGFAPRRLLVASACNLVNLWIPAIADLKQMGLVS